MTLVGGLDEYGRPNGSLYFQSWHNHAENMENIVNGGSFDYSQVPVIDGSSITFSDGDDTLTATNVRRVAGTDGDDVITMGDADNDIRSHGGNDTLTGGAGLDRFYDLGLEDNVAITDYEALERIGWRVEYHAGLSGETIDTSDLTGMFVVADNVISFSDDSGYTGNVIIGDGHTHSDYSIATIVARDNDFMQITLNNGDVNDGYFHVNDDYEKSKF